MQAEQKFQQLPILGGSGDVDLIINYFYFLFIPFEW